MASVKFSYEKQYKGRKQNAQREFGLSPIPRARTYTDKTLKAAHRAFCAGVDLREIAEAMDMRVQNLFLIMCNARKEYPGMFTWAKRIRAFARKGHASGRNLCPRLHTCGPCPR